MLQVDSYEKLTAADLCYFDSIGDSFHFIYKRFALLLFTQYFRLREAADSTKKPFLPFSWLVSMMHYLR